MNLPPAFVQGVHYNRCRAYIDRREASQVKSSQAKPFCDLGPGDDRFFLLFFSFCFFPWQTPYYIHMRK